MNKSFVQMPLHHCAHRHIEQQFFFRTIIAGNNRSCTAKIVQWVLEGDFQQSYQDRGLYIEDFFTGLLYGVCEWECL